MQQLYSSCPQLVLTLVYYTYSTLYLLQQARQPYILVSQSLTLFLSALSSTSRHPIFCYYITYKPQILSRVAVVSNSIGSRVVFTTLYRAVVLIQSSSSRIIVSFSRAAISVYLYPLVSFQRHQFYTFQTSLSRLFACRLLSACTPYTQALYSITSQITAVYRRQEHLINRP